MSMNEIADDLFEAPAEEAEELVLPPDVDLIDESLGPEEPWPPPGAELVLSGTVLGEPKPAGSKGIRFARRGDGSVIIGENGRPKMWTRDMSGQAGENWRSDIRDAVLRAWADREPLDEPLAISITFYGPRTKGHFGSGKNEGVLKESAPRYPHASKLADGAKLLRAFEDALNKLVWKDDRRFVDHRIARRYGNPRAEYRLYRLPAKVGTEETPEQPALSL
jgi:Holliday junction resolvase RusA-like endonuclease